ncbi:hypothetical protein [Actinomadura rubrisoli]|uniref:Uncharacterized protein n=1 Tax=Actinomadura rubrisoli TaxID=2530368 RepID=A0A4R5CBA6_9ACTN|nr:hypothetical protein [Actinomadura rubrisoli]TDD97228.1 hypothetical protein E1298_01975 [Actinomadura rubrisoli]
MNELFVNAFLRGKKEEWYCDGKTKLITFTAGGARIWIFKFTQTSPKRSREKARAIIPEAVRDSVLKVRHPTEDDVEVWYTEVIKDVAA